jgi:hypothetical protein
MIQISINNVIKGAVRMMTAIGFFRVTENGEKRITEDGNRRIKE